MEHGIGSGIRVLMYGYWKWVLGDSVSDDPVVYDCEKELIGKNIKWIIFLCPYGWQF